MSSFAELGRRMSAWTTRLVLCALVVLTGWGFGRQVMQWWSATGSVPVGEPVQGVWEELAAAEPQLVLADGHWEMVWQGSAVSRQEALVLVRARCQRLLAEVPLPADPPGPAEQRLLTLLANTPPVAEQPGRWSLYQKEGPLAFVVGTRPTGAGDDEAPGAARRRIVVWGVALSHGELGWAAYAFHPVRRRASPGDRHGQESQGARRPRGD